jgi:hypothetical protein
VRNIPNVFFCLANCSAFKAAALIEARVYSVPSMALASEASDGYGESEDTSE